MANMCVIKGLTSHPKSLVLHVRLHLLKIIILLHTTVQALQIHFSSSVEKGVKGNVLSMGVIPGYSPIDWTSDRLKPYLSKAR